MAGALPISMWTHSLRHMSRVLAHTARVWASGWVRERFPNSLEPDRSHPFLVCIFSLQHNQLIQLQINGHWDGDLKLYWRHWAVDDSQTASSRSRRCQQQLADVVWSPTLSMTRAEFPCYLKTVVKTTTQALLYATNGAALPFDPYGLVQRFQTSALVTSQIV